MLQHDTLGHLDWLSLGRLSASLGWDDSPHGVVSGLDVQADLLVARESGECHWRDGATVQVKWLGKNVWVGLHSDLLAVSDNVVSQGLVIGLNAED